MSAKVLIVDAHAETYADALAAEFPDLAIRTAATLAGLPADAADAEVMITFGLGAADDMLHRLPGLKWVQCLATGVDHFVKAPSLRPEVILTSTRGMHGPQMREMALFLLTSLSQNLFQVMEDFEARNWIRRPRPLLWRKTAVVVGVGVVGIAIGQALKALEMQVIGVTRTLRQVDGFDSMVPTDRLIEAAAAADYLINVLPGDAENENLIGRAVFDAMKPTAYFVNLGRGDSVDDAALLDVLENRRIAGAALDVFRGEPLAPDSPFWRLPNTLVTSHLGGMANEYVQQALSIVIDNMHHYLAGDRGNMRNVVDH